MSYKEHNQNKLNKLKITYLFLRQQTASKRIQMYMKKKLLNKNKIYYHQNLTQPIVLHQMKGFK